MSNIIDSIQLSGVTYQIQGSGGGGVPESTFTAYTATTDERISQDEEVTAAGLNALNDKITPTVELTQAQYDALVTAGTVAQDTYYIITDAQAVDLTNYYTKTETNTLLGGKQATLVSGTNIKTVNSQSLLGSGNIDIQGGSTYTAGRGIDITNDTISFSLPISAGTGNYSIIEGGSTTASGNYSHAEGINTNASSAASHAEGQSTSANGINSHAEGYYTIAYGYYSHTEGQQTSASSFAAHAEGINTNAIGQYSHAEGNRTTASGHYSHAEGFGTETKNQSEHASGQYNVSSSGSSTFGDSGNTLFSVGNGTANNARHNAFEIRQNGDIYLTKDGQDVKLQDQLGGGGSITVDTALDSSSTHPVQNKALYDELRIIESTETVLRWAQSDGGYSSNYPSGCTKVVITIDEQQMTDGGYTLCNDNYDCFGVFNIESNGGVITVETLDCEYKPTTSIIYSISGNVVTVEYPTITNVTKIGTSYDNYWTWKAIVNNATPLIDKVIENEEVTAAALNVLNDKIGDIETLLSQI